MDGSGPPEYFVTPFDPCPPIPCPCPGSCGGWLQMDVGGHFLDGAACLQCDTCRCAFRAEPYPELEKPKPSVFLPPQPATWPASPSWPAWPTNLARCLWDAAGLTLARVVGLEWAWSETRRVGRAERPEPSAESVAEMPEVADDARRRFADAGALASAYHRGREAERQLWLATATPPLPRPPAGAAEPARMTPKVLAAVIGTTAAASLVQVDIYLPRKHWWQRRERVSPSALARAIGNNAAMALAIAAEPEHEA